MSGDRLDLIAAAELGLKSLERELSDLLGSVCLLDSDHNPRRDTIDAGFEPEAAALEASIASVRATIARARGE